MSANDENIIPVILFMMLFHSYNLQLVFKNKKNIIHLICNVWLLVI